MQAQTQHKNVPTLMQTIAIIAKESKGQLLSANGLHMSILMVIFQTFEMFYIKSFDAMILSLIERA